MSKVVLAFSCKDSYGRDYELVLSSDKQWYYRAWCYNGYGMGYSKWEKTAPRDVTFFTTNSHYDGQSGCEGHAWLAKIECGFSAPAYCTLNFKGKKIKQPRYRLPK